MGKKVDDAVAILNGLVGDYLVRSENPLATGMGLYLGEQPVPLTKAALGRAYRDATARAVVLVHGVMCTETSWRFADGSDYGSKLQADFGLTPLYLRYNSGLPIADNGMQLAKLLQALLAEYPCPLQELLLLGYSMGGLVVRSACHVATEQGLTWLPLVKDAIYVGTPHLGTTAERAGRIVAKLLKAIPDPYTKLIGEIGDLRSAGIKDLGDADLRHEDRAVAASRLSLRDPRHPVPLLPDIRHHLIAGSLSMDPRVAKLFGDAIVPLGSASGATLALAGASGEVGLSEEQVKVVHGRSHLELAHDDDVYAHIKAFCEGARP